jgi:hypothetical protein
LAIGINWNSSFGVKLQTGRDVYPRTALILNGGISRLSGSFVPNTTDTRALQELDQEYLFGGGRYVPVHVTAASIRKHVISKNPGIEVIMHSWAPELKRELLREFAPVLWAFETNPGKEYFQEVSLPGCKHVEGGCPWIAVSWSYSIKVSVELMRQREIETGVQYSNVMFYRPDVLVFTDIIIPDILTDRRTVYTTNWANERCGDFHHIMARDVAFEFAKFYDVVTTGSKSCSVGCLDGKSSRQCFKRGYLDGVGIPSQNTHVSAGIDEDVYRTMFRGQACSANKHLVDLKEFGFTRDDYEDIQRDRPESCPVDVAMPIPLPCSCSTLQFS